MDYIFYHDNSSVTGKELKAVLNISGGSIGRTETRPNKVIRWGNPGDMRYNATNSVLNSKQACLNAGNKERALQLMTEANIKVPPAVTGFTGELLIGRTASHMQGRGAFFITSERDFILAQRNLHCTHFMKYIPTDREYRVHVFNNEILAVSEKLMQDNCTNLQIRNYETGWHFRYIDNASQEVKDIAKAAVSCLGLNMGAVDVIKSVNGNLYVLEVNTAPSLVKPREDGTIERMPAFDLYVSKIRNWLNER